MQDTLGSPISLARAKSLVFDALIAVTTESEFEHTLNSLAENIEFDRLKLLSVAIMNHRSKLMRDFDEYAEFYLLQDHGTAYGRAECSPDWPL